MGTQSVRCAAIAALLAGALLGAGCTARSLLGDFSGWFEGWGSSDGTGTLRLLVTDGPYPIDLLESAEVTITRVEVFRAHSGRDDDEAELADEPGDELGDELDDELDSEDEPDDGQSARDVDDGSDDDEDDADDADDADDSDGAGGTVGFVVVFEGERSFDLLELRDGNTDLLADAEVPAGEYSKMRVFVSEGVVTLKDGREFRLNVPSGDRSGIKLRFDFEIVDSEETTLVLDIDLSRAFIPIPGGDVEDASQIERFQFRPSYAMKLVDSGDLEHLADDGDDGADAEHEGEADDADDEDEPDDDGCLRQTAGRQ